MAKLPDSLCIIFGAAVGRIGRVLQSLWDRASEVIVVNNECVRDRTHGLCEARLKPSP